MVCVQYKDKFIDASHVCFDGCLDDPLFRKIAIQEIKEYAPDTIVLSESGRLDIKTSKGRERVRLSYNALFFGKQITWGYPFKDINSIAIREKSRSKANDQE